MFILNCEQLEGEQNSCTSRSFSPETQGAGVAWKVRNSVTLIRHFHPIEMYQREAENQEIWITWRYCDLNLEILWSITSIAIEVLSREDMRGQQGLATGARGVAYGWLNSRQISAWGHECITIVTWILNLALSDEKDTGFIQNCCMEPTFFTLNFYLCVYVFCWLQGCRESLFADSDSYLELYAMLRQWWSQDINLQSIVLTTTTSRNLSLKWWFMSAYLLYVVEMLRDSTRSH